MINRKDLCPGYGIEIDEVTESAWNQIILKFDDASLYQTWQYGAVRLGEGNISHIVLKREGEIVAASQCWIVKAPLIKSGIAYVKCGPMWRRSGKEIDIEIIQKIIRAMKLEYVEKRRLVLRIVPNDLHEDRSLLDRIYINEGMRSHPWPPTVGALSSKELIMDLSPPLDLILKSCHRDCRSRLERSEKCNLRILEGQDDDLFKDVKSIYNEMLGRKKFANFINIDDLRRVQKRLPNSLKMNILIGEIGGEPAAASVFSNIGNTGVALIWATGEKALNTYASYALQWETIKRLKEKGCLWYDLGGINRKRNPGGYQFKTKLAGKGGREMVLRQYDDFNNYLSLFVVRMGETIKIAHETVLRLSSRLQNYFNKMLY